MNFTACTVLYVQNVAVSKRMKLMSSDTEAVKDSQEEDNQRSLSPAAIELENFKQVGQILKQ